MIIHWTLAKSAKYAPELKIIIGAISEDRFRISVEDNGPGIVKEQVGRVFGKIIVRKQIKQIKMLGVPTRYRDFCERHVWAINNRKADKNMDKNFPQNSYSAMYFELFIDTRKNGAKHNKAGRN